VLISDHMGASVYDSEETAVREISLPIRGHVRLTERSDRLVYDVPN
jgi:hypothetical protein